MFETIHFLYLLYYHDVIHHVSPCEVYMGRLREQLVLSDPQTSKVSINDSRVRYELYFYTTNQNKQLNRSGVRD